MLVYVNKIISGPLLPSQSSRDRHVIVVNGKKNYEVSVTFNGVTFVTTGTVVKDWKTLEAS